MEDGRNDEVCGRCALSAPKHGAPGKLVCLAGAFPVDPSCERTVYELLSSQGVDLTL